MVIVTDSRILIYKASVQDINNISKKKKKKIQNHSFFFFFVNSVLLILLTYILRAESVSDDVSKWP